MAERYLLGSQKIIYRSKNWTTGLNITVEILTPSLERLPPITLSELSDGLYYCWHSFDEEGMYGAIFYENGVKTACHSFLVTSEKEGGGRIIVPRR